MHNRPHATGKKYAKHAGQHNNKFVSLTYRSPPFFFLLDIDGLGHSFLFGLLRKLDVEDAIGIAGGDQRLVRVDGQAEATRNFSKLTLCGVK